MIYAIAILLLLGLAFAWWMCGRPLYGYCRWCGSVMHSRRAQNFHDAAKCCAATDSMNAAHED